MRVDQQLIRQLHLQLGSLREHDLEARARRGEPPLAGEDAFQHAKMLVQSVVESYESALVEQGLPELEWEVRQDLVDALEARLFGAGSLQQLLEDPEVEEIDINGYEQVFVEYANGETARVPPVAASDEDLVETVQTLAAHVGLSARQWDLSNPEVNLRLDDGSRLFGVMAVSPQPSVAIRKHRFKDLTLKDLVAAGTIDEDLAGFLRALVRGRKNIMIAGATSAGKTTLLRALSSEIDPSERLITVERSLELGLHDFGADRHPNCVALEERLPNAEGVGAVTMARLVRNSLRMNPSRVIVGEVLGDEIVTMLNAMSQGNDGSLSTIHADSSLDVITKIATYATQAPERLPWEATGLLVASALDFIVFIRRIRTPEGQIRVVESVREVTGFEDGQVMTSQLWAPAAPSVAGPAVRQRDVAVMCEADLVDAGWDPLAAEHDFHDGPTGAGGGWA